MTETACEGCKTSCSDSDRAACQADEKTKQAQALRRRLAGIDRKVLVLSGKGGVGKSTVAASLAATLAVQGYETGLLDIDIHGPSTPTLFGLSGQRLTQGPNGLQPVAVGTHLKVMSIAFCLEHPDQALIWRGPMKAGVIEQFVRDVDWGELDYLIVDAPPGTGDEPLSMCQLIPELDGAVVVTTPQEMASVDVRKSMVFCEQIGVDVLGIVENMSGFRCPKCGEVTHIFQQHGGARLAEERGVPLLASIPLDPAVGLRGDAGKMMLVDVPEHAPFARLADAVVEQLNRKRS
jgi:Mrp family chromosome partitioning ATPase